MDTGYSYSIIPHSSQKPPSGPLLCSANGQPIPSWGEQWLTVVFGGHYYTWDFLLADVQFYIIGVDFLQHFKLVVDMAANDLRPTLSTADVTAALSIVEAPSSPSLHTVEALELGPPATYTNLRK